MEPETTSIYVNQFFGAIIACTCRIRHSRPFTWIPLWTPIHLQFR